MKTARKSVALSLGAAAVALSVAGAVTENTFAEGNQVTIPDQAFFNCLTNGGVTSNPGDNPVQVPVVDAANRIIDISHFSEYAYVNVKCSDKGITSIEGFQNLPFFDYETGGWSAYHGSVIMADFKNNKIIDVSEVLDNETLLKLNMLLNIFKIQSIIFSLDNGNHVSRQKCLFHPLIISPFFFHNMMHICYPTQYR